MIKLCPELARGDGDKIPIFVAGVNGLSDNIPSSTPLHTGMLRALMSVRSLVVWGKIPRGAVGNLWNSSAVVLAKVLTIITLTVRIISTINAIAIIVKRFCNVVTLVNMMMYGNAGSDNTILFNTVSRSINIIVVYVALDVPPAPLPQVETVRRILGEKIVMIAELDAHFTHRPPTYDSVHNLARQASA